MPPVWLLFAHFLQGFGQGLVALVEEAHGLHGQRAGFLVPGLAHFLGQTLQLSGVVGVVARHVAHQRQQPVRGGRLGGVTVVVLGVLMVVLVGVGMVVSLAALVGVGVGMGIGVLMCVLMAVGGVVAVVDMGMGVGVGVLVLVDVLLGAALLMVMLVVMIMVMVVMFVIVVVMMVLVIVDVLGVIVHCPVTSCRILYYMYIIPYPC